MSNPHIHFDADHVPESERHNPHASTDFDWAQLVEDCDGQLEKTKRDLTEEEYERDREEHFDDAQSEIQSADIVLLDDVGSESDKFKSQSNVSRLRRVLATCEHKWTMVNANFQRELWPSKFDVRVADRLGSMAYLDLTGVPSYRTKLHKPPTQ